MRPLVAEHIETLKPYIPGKPIEETERELGITGVIKLASNENPLGPSPLAVEAMRKAVTEVHLYPDGACFKLVQRLAQHLGVLPEEVFVGSGSNEVIELLVRTFMNEGEEALLCESSFAAYKVALQAQGRKFREVPMRPGLGYDLEAMAAALGERTRLVFLANPDNPTGTGVGKAALERFLARVSPDTVVALDEAYFEYVDWADYPNGLDYFRKFPNVVVLRTFSKIYGLGGVRLGYAISNPERVAYLNRTRMPFNVSSLAQAAGLAALDDVRHLQKTREVTLQGVKELTAGLTVLGVKVPPSHANFVFCDFGRPAMPIYDALLRKGVITRPMNGYGFPQALRISVGTQEQNRKLLSALREIL